MDLDDIDRIAVLGAGSMGHGIAEVAAMAGFEVALRDINEELVQKGYDQIEWSLGKLAEQDRLPEEEASAALQRVEPVVDLEAALNDVDFLIEAVPERMDLKREVYDEVERHAPEEAVFATNTSSLSITELSEATDRPERFCGMHFFNPPVRMQLVEVIAGGHSAEETLDLAEALADAFDKTPIRVRKDSPGFVVNRVLVPLLNEAAWLVETGEATVASVDSTTKFDMGLPMGAFELADQVGIDVSLDVLTYMHEVLGEAYTPAPLLEDKVDADKLGKKTGAGFYDYDDGGVEIPPDEASQEIRRRLVAIMANEVAKLVGHEVAEVPEIDEAMQLGAGFPEGPARMADSIGLDELQETLTELLDRTGAARYEPAQVLRDYAESGRGFYSERDGGDVPDFEVLNLDRTGRVGHIELNRPHRMNTVTEELLDELERALETFEGDEEVRSILITGAGDRAFCAGADVSSFASGGDPLTAAELSRKGQRIFGRLEEVALPVVAGIDGYCLGGGMELATAADLRVASERSEFGQPEANLGLLPGWGGTQRLRHLVGESRAKEIVLTADRYDPETMAEYGFVNEVVGNDEFEERAFEMASELAAGPPIAYRLIKRAMLAGRDDLDAGLELEAQAFGLLMTTDDLVEGITAFMEDRDPEFEGR